MKREGLVPILLRGEQMLRLKYATRVALIGALLIAPACGSNSDPSDPEPSSAGGGSGGGGSSSRAGTAGKGRGGEPMTNPGEAGAGGESGEGAEAGAGGEGGQASKCPGCASGFCLDDGSCVDCLPKDDHCPSGQYCTDEYQCAAGCKNDKTSCASGVCGKDHNCERCIADSECSAGFICSGGTCSAACGAAQEGTSTGCAGSLICCSERCSNLAVDSKNCGACGNSCAQGQFCGRTSCAAPVGGEGGAAGAGPEAASCVVNCLDATFSNVCSVAKVTVILDSNKNTSDGNRVPGRAIGAALRDNCPTRPTLSEAEQDSVEALNITTGRPVSDSSELLVVAGGPFFQNLEGYLEDKKIMPLYWTYNSEVTEYRSSATQQVVASLPIAGDHDSHDLFIIQFTRDPASGSLILNEQGFWLSGTVAGAYQVTHGLLPDLAQQDRAWYVYEWTDQDGDKAPALNEIQLLDSGK